MAAKNASAEAALHDGYTEPVRDALWGHIYLRPAYYDTVTSAPFLRMHGIMQLGPAYLVYPGATHTRVAHSFGVYHLARRLLLRLELPTFVTAEGVHSFLCAALLHDVGHFAYAHSLKELLPVPHEELSARFIEGGLARAVEKTGALAAKTAAIVGHERPANDKETLFFRRLLSGTLDVDKLDYLNRDARCCGVPYGAQDVDFIFSVVHCDEETAAERGLLLRPQGIPSVESVLFSKYLMYRAVYWHHRVRAATAMVKKAVRAALEGGFIADEELYPLDDAAFFAAMRRLEEKTPLAALAGEVKAGHIFPLYGEFPPRDAPFPLEGEAKKDTAALEQFFSEKIGRERGKKARPEDIVVDIPEPVSFESDLFVSAPNGGNNAPVAARRFSEIGGIFHAQGDGKRRNPSPGDIFADALRTIRVFARSD